MSRQTCEIAVRKLANPKAFWTGMGEAPTVSASPWFDARALYL